MRSIREPHTFDTNSRSAASPRTRIYKQQHSPTSTTLTNKTFGLVQTIHLIQVSLAAMSP